MFAVEVQTTFSAAHALRLLPQGQEPLHGHNFHVTVRVAADHLDELETVVDFHVLQAGLDAIVGPWKNRNLNEIEPFNAAENPTAERIAELIGREMHGLLGGVAGSAKRHLRVVEVRVMEASDCTAMWTSGAV